MSESELIELSNLQNKQFNEMVKVLGIKEVEKFINQSSILSVYPIRFSYFLKKFEIDDSRIKHCLFNARKLKNGLYMIQMKK